MRGVVRIRTRRGIKDLKNQMYIDKEHISIGIRIESKIRIKLRVRTRLSIRMRLCIYMYTYIYE